MRIYMYFLKYHPTALTRCSLTRHASDMKPLDFDIVLISRCFIGIGWKMIYYVSNNSWIYLIPNTTYAISYILNAYYKTFKVKLMVVTMHDSNDKTLPDRFRWIHIILDFYLWH